MLNPMYNYYKEINMMIKVVLWTIESISVNPKNSERMCFLSQNPIMV